MFPANTRVEFGQVWYGRNGLFIIPLHTLFFSTNLFVHFIPELQLPPLLPVPPHTTLYSSPSLSSLRRLGANPPWSLKSILFRTRQLGEWDPQAGNRFSDSPHPSWETPTKTKVYIRCTGFSLVHAVDLPVESLSLLDSSIFSRTHLNNSPSSP
jgi:hypothetical protein